MKLINKNIHTVTMKYPASWHGTLEREGLVSGNGHIRCKCVRRSAERKCDNNPFGFMVG